jgi:UDP-2,4-diacetamido-2,4,6-trideoxy-beta-L-altropyranose hydrolase
MERGRGTRCLEAGHFFAQRNPQTGEAGMKPRVIFRADAGPAIGGGHVMRSLSLASVFAERGWQIGFAASEESFKSMPQLHGASFEKLVLRADAAGEAAEIAARWPDGCDLLVADHYGRDAAFERACRPFAKRILVIDDLADRAHEADVLVDSSAASPSVYASLVPAGCMVLAGPRFASIHSSFRLAREAALPRRDGRPVARILVSLGQSDPENATGLALDALDHAGFSGAVDVVLGQSAPHLAAIRRRAKHRITLHVNASNMAALMATSDFAIGAGGTTAFERCSLGLPSLVIEIAANQRAVIERLTENGAAVSAGAQSGTSKEQIGEQLKELLGDSQALRTMASACAQLVDGRGADRVYLAAIGSELSKDRTAVQLRLAERADEAWLLELQKNPKTRAFFTNPAVPSAEEHAAWFARQLSRNDSLFAIVEAAGAAAGYVRLDRLATNEAVPAYVVSIAIDPAMHGRGIGVAALALARRAVPGAVLNAKVLPENEPSKRLFARAGYQSAGDDLYRSLPQ